MEAPHSARVRAAEQLSIVRRGLVDLIEESELAQRLEASLDQGRALRIKFGMDPTSPDLHVGHAVPLLKLRALQALGHQIVLIVGDATALIGDPSGRNKLRPPLTRDEIEHNLTTYVAQVGHVLDVERTEIRRNSEWFDGLRFDGVLRLLSRATVARMLERDTFQERLQAGEPIGLHELLYPLMQGWDSVMVRADVELGGTDQLFNLLRGRDLQREEGQAGQVCITTPLIDGLDGRKMSKSYGNAVQLTDPPPEMFGKIMSITDEAMGNCFTLLTCLDPGEIGRLLAGHPREAKARLAEEVTAFFHGAGAGRAAREAFDRQFRDHELPEDLPTADWPAAAPPAGLPLMVLLKLVGLASSSSAGRRLVEGGGVRLDGQVARDPRALVRRPAGELLLQAGKRHFLRLRG